jgi:uracil-DNA glycosylase
MPEDIAQLLAEIRACRACAAHLPLGPRPVLHISATARLLIASQAPGTKVHHAGISFWDASGDRLRGWLAMEKAQFYDSRQVAILPVGMCYPGRLPQGGDAPPRTECAPLWRARILDVMPALRLTLLVGSYAQALVLGPGKVGERVRDFRAYLPRHFPLPHPSWRTAAWERANPWFGAEVLPALREAVAKVLAGGTVPAAPDPPSRREREAVARARPQAGDGSGGKGKFPPSD